MRQRLLRYVRSSRDPAPLKQQHFIISALETDKSQLENMEKRIRGSPSLTQDIAGCITRINNRLSQYTVRLNLSGKHLSSS